MSKITKIVLEIGEQEILLTVAEAKELKQTLSGIFRSQEIKVVPYN